MKNSKNKIIDFISQGRRNCTRLNLRCINFWCSLLLYNYFYQYYCIYPFFSFSVFTVLFNSSKVNFHFQCLNSLLLEKASLSSNYMCTFSAATNKNCTGETQSRFFFIKLICWLIYENWGSLGVNLNEKARWLWYIVETYHSTLCNRNKKVDLNFPCTHADLNFQSRHFPLIRFVRSSLGSF